MGSVGRAEHHRQHVWTKGSAHCTEKTICSLILHGKNKHHLHPQPQLLSYKLLVRNGEEERGKEKRIDSSGDPISQHQKEFHAVSPWGRGCRQQMDKVLWLWRTSSDLQCCSALGHAGSSRPPSSWSVSSYLTQCLQDSAQHSADWQTAERNCFHTSLTTKSPN